MRFSLTLSYYIGRHFVANFLMLFAAMLGLIYLFDCVELLRRASSKSEIPLSLIFEMAALKLPQMGQEAFPFAILFGAMMAFWRLSRSHELVVMRAAGVSVWKFLLPVVGAAVILGSIQISIINPVGSVLLTRFERLEARHFRGQTNLLAISRTGLWLRQANQEGQAVVHAQGVVQSGRDVELTEVTIFAYRGADHFRARFEADRARLEDGFWHLYDATVYVPEEPPRHEAETWFETDLTVGKIQDSFAPPETMSFWSLPGFIETLDKAGFSATRHRLHFHSLLAVPLLLCAMVLIAATFTLRHARRGGTVYVISAGVLTGFLLYFFSDIVFALGLSDSIPVVLAAWTPSGVSTLLGLAMLLHLEDG